MWSFLKSWVVDTNETDDNLEDESLLAELDLLPEDELEEAVKHGVVTELEEDSGLIDGEFYFSRSLIPKISMKPLQVGDNVQYKAVRKSENQQWTVSEITLVKNDEWDGTNVGNSDLVISTQNCSRDVGKIVDINKNDSKITAQVEGEHMTEELKFPVTMLDFQAANGDLVILELALESTILDDVRNARVLGAEPLRTQTLPDSVISSWWSNTRKGIVDSNIFFTSNSFTHSYVPRVNDCVRVHAIECEPSSANRNCNWRATRVVPKGFSATSFREQPNQSTLLNNSVQSGFIEELTKDKFGVHIEDTINVGIVQKGQSITYPIPIWNYNEDTTDPKIMLKGVKFKGENRIIKPIKPAAALNKAMPIEILSKSKTIFNIKCTGHDFGLNKVLAVFNFNQDGSSEDFEVGSYIIMEVRDSILDSLHNQIVPKTERFTHNNGQLFRDNNGRNNVIKGQKKKSLRPPVFIKRRLAEYPIPKRFEDLYFDDDPSALLDNFPYLGEELSFANYKDKFANLLYLEEMEQTEQMTQFRLCGVPFEVQGPYLSLEVPGLAEKRPSLALGDTAIATLSNVSETQKFEGCIHEVRSRSILLMFDPKFHDLYCGEVYDVEFHFSRGQFRRQHQAIDEVMKNFGKEVLFPNAVKTNAPQVEFVLENPILDYTVYRSKNKIQSNRHLNLSSSTSNTSLSPRRKSVAQQLFGNSLPPPGSEWVMPKLPIALYKSSKKVTIARTGMDKSLEYEFKMDNYKSSKGKKPVMPYVSKEKLSRVRNGQLMLQWVNKTLNPEQKNAVMRILSGQARPLPYIIYGPPGTGKTVTVVETILQIFKLRSDSRILVVTPSNSAADLIVERIHNSQQVQIGDLARLNAIQRAPEGIPDIVKQYSFAKEDHILGKVVRHRIVVATCSTSGALYKLDLSEGHFTHCFVDEAGETTEPETMTSIGLMASSSKSQIILAGDPKQLGPVLQSAEAKVYGLEVSFLERLASLPLYQRDETRFKDHGSYDPMLVTKLVRNYRSHEDIIKIPSDLFYDAELLPEATEKITTKFLTQEILPNSMHPVIFHGVRGKNYQEGTSPSWFNPTEALQVANYYQQLMNMQVKPEDIGIIAPYRQQTSKLRQVFKSMELPLPKIGSVEEFQGQERSIIIITTVRSAEHQSEANTDAQRGLGFLRSEKRFNVAITRAMSLLIVIGDPHLLSGDPSWRAFLKHCISLGAYTGCDLPLGIDFDANVTEE